MANFTRYNFDVGISDGEYLLTPIVDANGSWVKFDEVKEYLPSASNNSASMKCRLYRNGYKCFETRTEACIRGCACEAAHSQ